jgi:hypothetical protein
MTFFDSVKHRSLRTLHWTCANRAHARLSWHRNLGCSEFARTVCVGLTSQRGWRLVQQAAGVQPVSGKAIGFVERHGAIVSALRRMITVFSIVRGAGSCAAATPVWRSPARRPPRAWMRAVRIVAWALYNLLCPLLNLRRSTGQCMRDSFQTHCAGYRSPRCRPPQDPFVPHRPWTRYSFKLLGRKS